MVLIFCLHNIHIYIAEPYKNLGGQDCTGTRFQNQVEKFRCHEFQVLKRIFLSKYQNNNVTKEHWQVFVGIGKYVNCII